FTAAEAAKSLYTHMIANSCDVNLKLKAEKLRKSDSDDSAQKLLQLWKIVINIFNQLYLVLPEKELEAKRLLFLLNLMCSEYNVGAIPVSADSVTVGDASMIRANDTKAVILLGVNDGVFPAQVADNGIFTENELVELESNGILFADTKKSRQIQEKLFFYAAVSCASEKVILIYNSAKPSRGSVGILRIESLIKNVNKSKFGENTADYCFSPIAAAENINKINNAALIKRLDKLGYNYKKIAEQNPISDKSAQITPLFDKKMSISPSKLEKYTYCGFSYFGQYVLKLAQNKKAEFSNAEIGTYIHKVLEEFVSSHIVNNKFEKPSAEKIKQEVDNITEKYILSVCGTITEKSKRFLYILKRIKITLYKLVDNICRELENCGFVPFGFEVKLGENDIKCAEYKTESGLQIILRGTIDRIDILEKNGKKYIRVVDYKTGAKVYSKKAVENGLDLQMFLYLFAVCNSMENSVPAGVLYLPSKLNVCKTDTEKLAAEVEEAFDKQFKRNGLVINDENVLSEMEPQLIGKYIPALKNADGQFSLRSSIASIEEIGALSIGLENYIKKLAESMISGNMSVSPLKLNSDYNACKYCDLKSACRLSLEKCVSREKNENTIKF
ncbi:MAG: PD-(D/E)XK nuclease family protein, partial [Clostridia bacterium]